MSEYRDNYHITRGLFPKGIAFYANNKGYIPLSSTRDLSPTSAFITDEFLDLHQRNEPAPLKNNIGNTSFYQTPQGKFYSRHFYPNNPESQVDNSDLNSAQAVGLIHDYFLGKIRIARSMVSVVREPAKQEGKYYQECDPCDLSEANLAIVVASTIGHHPLLVQDNIHLSFPELAGDPSKRALLRTLDMCILLHGYETLTDAVGTCGVELVAGEVEKHAFYNPTLPNPFDSYVKDHGNGKTPTLRAHEEEIRAELDRRKLARIELEKLSA